MSPKFRTLVAVLVLRCVAAPETVQAQIVREGPAAPPRTAPPTVRAEARPWHVRALMGTAQLTPDSALALLEARHLSAAFMQRVPRAERRALVERVRVKAAEAGTVRVQEDSAGVHMMLGGGPEPVEVFFTIDPQAPFGILALELRRPSATPPAASAPEQPFSWETLAARVRDAEAAGLSGQVLVRRNGAEFFRSSFGMTDKAQNRRTTADAIYCIGSAPMDFTATAARLLAHRGKLDLDAPITRWIKNVPKDKAKLTPRMILESRSGLPNFHGRPEDWDQDLAYIDRDAAVRRILSMPQISAPGSTRQTSHSAYGLLAAIVELASGQTFQEFVRKEIFDPLGMTRTGFYGETLGLTADAFAVGYGRTSTGAPNIPPNWGPTSWLVMGSGGMFSTLDDLRRYHDGIAAGQLFDGQKPSPWRGISRNGSDRGFIMMRIADGQGDEILFMSNTDGAPAMEPLTRGLVSLMQTRR